jgi:hypothetical protein
MFSSKRRILFSPSRKGLNMKIKVLLAAVLLGMLTASSAHAFGYWNSATYASRHQLTPQPARQPGAEIQIAVNAAAAAGTRIPGASVWYGSSPRSHASHSH